MNASAADSAVCAPQVFDGDHWHHDSALLIAGEHIVGLAPIASLPPELPRTTLSSGMLAPGFVDLQVNGGGGLLFNNAPTPDTLLHIAASHRRYGTTGLLPTLLSDTQAVLRTGANAVREARRQLDTSAAAILGLHIEGPFFAAARRGTHRADRLRACTQDDVDWLCSLADLRCLLTVAPEVMAAGQIRQLCEAGLMVFAGHSDANYETVEAAKAEGLRGFTHLFNAMSPLLARQPGVTGAALASDTGWLGIIADGHHVHPASIRIAHRCASPGRLFLVSDAMATVGSGQDWFTLYGERIVLRQGKLTNAAGTLAGSAIGLIDAVRYCHTVVGLALEECLRMASRYPARVIGDATRGHLGAGARADMVLLDDALQVQSTWLGGQRQDYAIST